MQDVPKSVGEARYSPNIPALPDDLPPTIRRLRGDPSQSIYSTGFDNLLEVEDTLAVPIAEVPDMGQPSAQMRALRTNQIAVATAIITGSFFASRLLGLMRASLMAAVFGSSTSVDAFTTAFVIPNAIYNLVAAGALSSAFIPIFSEYLITKRDTKAAWYITSSIITIVTTLLTLLAIVAFIFMPQLTHVYADGVFSVPGKGDQVILLSRIMLIQPIFLGISVIITSVLQARQLFLLPALGSVFYNLGPIAGIGATIIDQSTGIFGGHLGILGPTLGILAGALLQLLAQIPGLVSGKMKYTFSLDIFNPGVQAIAKSMVPRLANSLALYVGAASVTSSLLSNIQIKGVYFGYQQAFQLTLLPIGLLGMALSQAAFPSMAIFVSTKDWERMRATVLSGARIILYLSIPTSLLMIVLAQPITSLLFVWRTYHQEDAYKIYVPLIFFAIGIPANSLIEIVVRAYYALQDARTAVTIGIIELFVVAGLSFALIGPMGAGGLALATSLGIICETFVLLLLLRSRIGNFTLRPLLNFTVGVLAASLVATLAALLIYTLLAVGFQGLGGTGTLVTKGILLAQLSISGIAGGLVYYMGARFLGIEKTVPVDQMIARVGRRFGRRR